MRCRSPQRTCYTTCITQLPVIQGSKPVGSAQAAMAVPAIVAAGDTAARRFLEFFAATIRNKNTRLAYFRASERSSSHAETSNSRSHVCSDCLFVRDRKRARCQRKTPRCQMPPRLASPKNCFGWIAAALANGGFGMDAGRKRGTSSIEFSSTCWLVKLCSMCAPRRASSSLMSLRSTRSATSSRTLCWLNSYPTAAASRCASRS